MRFAEVHSSWNFVTLFDRDVNMLEWKGKIVKERKKKKKKVKRAI